MSPRLVSILARLSRCLRSRLTVALLILLVLGAMVAASLRVAKSEPSYNHIPARDWLELARTNRQSQPKVIAAFQGMGPAGAVFLGDALTRQPTRLDEWFLAHHHNIPGPVKKLLLKPQPQARDDTTLTLLNGLGTNAAPAIPQLITWLEVYSNTALVPYTNPAVTMVPQRIISVVSNGVKVTNVVQLYVSTGSGPTYPPYSISRTPPPLPANLTTQKQVVVSAPGLVTTNVTVMVKRTGATLPTPLPAFQLLTRFGSDDPRIIPLLLNPVDSYRHQGEFPFGTNLRMAAIRSIPLLVHETESKEQRRQLAAMTLLRLTLPQSGPARECMIRLLGSHNRATFDLAISSLQSTTEDLDQIIPLAAQSLLRFRNRTTDLYGNWQPPVYLALREFSRHRPLVIPQLQEVLPQADFYEQLGIVQLLGEIGRSNTVDQALLKSFTTNHAAALRAAAWFTLGKLNQDKTAEASGYLAQLEGGMEYAAWLSFEKLETLGPAAIPVLIRFLSHHNEPTVIKATETLGRMGPTAHAALAPLRTLQTHPHAEVRTTATAAIRLISTAPKAKGAE